MDPLSVAASVVGVATAGIQISVKIVTLAGQVATASNRISDIGNDISLTASILHQLGDLINEKSAGGSVSILSKGGLETTKSSAETCRKIFVELEVEISKASEVLRGRKHRVGEKVKLSIIEKAKWPFLQPGLEVLRASLREAKGTLMLMLQLATLGLSKKMTELNSSASTNVIEQKDIIRSILILQHQQQPKKQQDTLRVNLIVKDNTLPGSMNTAPTKPDEQFSFWKTDSSRSNAAGNSRPDQQAQNKVVLDEAAHTRDISDEEPTPTASTTSNAPTVTEGTQKPKFSFSWTNPHGPLNSGSLFANGGSSNFGGHFDKPLFESKEPEMQVCFIDPKIGASSASIEVNWIWQRIVPSADEIRERLARMRAEDLLTVVEKLEGLHEFERGLVIQAMNFIGPTTDITLLSLKRTEKDLQQEGIVVKAVPSFRLFVAVKKTPQNSLFGPKPAPQRNRREVLQDLWRPTYIKVHKKYLLPETLDEYELPWEWDERDPNHIIIKRWIPEADQETLFEHTRLLKEKRELLRSRRSKKSKIIIRDSTDYSTDSSDGPRFGASQPWGGINRPHSDEPIFGSSGPSNMKKKGTAAMYYDRILVEEKKIGTDKTSGRADGPRLFGSSDKTTIQDRFEDLEAEKQDTDAGEEDEREDEDETGDIAAITGLLERYTTTFDDSK